MNRVPTAVVGAGHLGQIHARLLTRRNDAEVTLVVDPDPHARSRVAETLGVPVAPCLEDIPSRVEAVIVAAPTCRHFDITSRLLQRDKHCFVEKPMTVQAAEARKLVGLAASRRRTLQVGHVERFNAAWQEAAGGEPTVIFFQAVRHSAFPARSLDVGVVHDVMIHDIDLVLSLAGQLPHRVSAWGTTIVGPHEDVAQAWLEFPCGLTAHLDASRAAPQRRRHVTLTTPDQYIWCDLDQGQVTTATASSDLPSVAPEVAQWPVARRQAFSDALFERWMPLQTYSPARHNAIVREHDEFFQAVREGTSVTVDGQAACDAVAVAEEIVARIQAQKRRAVQPLRSDHTADAA